MLCDTGCIGRHWGCPLSLGLCSFVPLSLSPVFFSHLPLFCFFFCFVLLCRFCIDDASGQDQAWRGAGQVLSVAARPALSGDHPARSWACSTGEPVNGSSPCPGASAGSRRVTRVGVHTRVGGFPRVGGPWGPPNRSPTPMLPAWVQPWPSQWAFPGEAGGWGQEDKGFSGHSSPGAPGMRPLLFAQAQCP